MVVTLVIRIDKTGGEHLVGVYTSISRIPEEVRDNPEYWFQNVETNTEIHI